MSIKIGLWACDSWLCVCGGGVSMSRVMWWFPWQGCVLLGKCVYSEVVCVFCDLGELGFACVFC